MRNAARGRAMACGVLIVLFLTISLVFPAAAADLQVTIKGIRSDAGEILIALYDNPAGFESAIANSAIRGLMPDSGRLVGTAIWAKRGEQSTVFTQLQPGRYALIVIHDANDDGRLNRNAVGVPIEGYGFGNNAQAFLNAPSFDAAAITVGKADVSAAITLIYPTAPSAQDQKDYNNFIGSGSSRSQQH
jgi:uncharacterized protein (DUF2141 family)